MTPSRWSVLMFHTCALMLALILPVILFGSRAEAQSFAVLHYFSGGPDGGFSTASLTMDRAGRLYGTTAGGGTYNGNCLPWGCGVVFRLLQGHSGWVVQPIYIFPGELPPGMSPYAPITFGADGSIYGTTQYGGAANCALGCGTVFRLTPPSSPCKSTLCLWTETVIHPFQGGSDGAAPVYGALLLDADGNLYGTTTAGGIYGHGTVYKLTHSQSGWTGTVLYSFFGGGDGAQPWSSLIFDQQGNLYGTTRYGGDLSCGFSQGCGTVFELSPAGSGWTEKTLYTFEADDIGQNPTSALVFDASGNLFGTAARGAESGTVFELRPSNGAWTPSVLASFRGNGGPIAGLTIDAAGNLYGTTQASGARFQGSVFELSKQGSSWQLTTLHSFNITDGDHLDGGVVLDANGNIFGTASQGGSGSCFSGCGVVWEITP